MAAVFCGTLLPDPEPVRAITAQWVDTGRVWGAVGNPDGKDAYMAMFHHYYQIQVVKPKPGYRLVGITDDVMQQALVGEGWRDIVPNLTLDGVRHVHERAR